MGLIAYLSWKVDFRAAGVAVISAQAVLLLAAVLQLSAHVFLTALRWRLVARCLGGALPLHSALRFVWIGAFFGQVLPASVGGDAIRIWLYWLRCGRQRLAIHSVMLERLVMVVVLLLLVVAIQPGLAARGAPLSITVLVAAVLAGIVTALSVLLISRRLLAPYEKWYTVRTISGLADDVRALLSNPGAAVLLAVLSLTAHLNMVVTAWLISRALGLELTLADCTVLVPVISLAATLPVSLGGWGVREGAAISLLGLVGVANSDAFALSLLLGLSAVVVALPGSFLWLMNRREGRVDSL